jgi:cellulose biosynthesis protein BcsQ
MSDLFLEAVRNKYRFDSPQGLLSVEDLFDLPLTSARNGVANLNDVAKTINKRLKETTEESFVDSVSSTDRKAQKMLDIVKQVIAIKQEENEARRTAAERSEQKQKILEALANRKDQALQNASEEELKEMLKNL